MFDFRLVFFNDRLWWCRWKQGRHLTPSTLVKWQHVFALFLSREDVFLLYTRIGRIGCAPNSKATQQSPCSVASLPLSLKPHGIPPIIYLAFPPIPLSSPTPRTPIFTLLFHTPSASLHYHHHSTTSTLPPPKLTPPTHHRVPQHQKTHVSKSLRAGSRRCHGG